jgi:hypothetical protein
MRLLTCAAVVAFAFTGCQRDAPVEGNPYVGTYTLAAVDDDPLPVTYATGPNETTEYLGGAIAIRADGTYSLTLDRRRNQGGVETLLPGSYAGEYDRAGPAFDFRHPDGDFSGDVSGNGQLTLGLDGVVYTFDR